MAGKKVKTKHSATVVELPPRLPLGLKLLNEAPPVSSTDTSPDWYLEMHPPDGGNAYMRIPGLTKQEALSKAAFGSFEWILLRKMPTKP